MFKINEASIMVERSGEERRGEERRREERRGEERRREDYIDKRDLL